jgi:hypothetical protein
MALSRLDKQGVVYLCIAGLVVGGIISFYVIQKVMQPHVGADNCIYADARLTVRAPAGQTVLLVDQSEALSDGHKRHAANYVEQYVSDETRFPVRSRILLYTFSKNDFDPSNPRGPSFAPVVDLCRPPSEGNDLYQNNRKITRQFYERFFQPLSDVLRTSLAQEVGERSPILETLQFISRSQDVEESRRRKTLIIISDMLQHTESFSHYRVPRSYDYFREHIAPDVRADFRGWDIVLVYLRRYRDRQLQQQDHLDFWQRYFYDMGGKLVQVVGVD